MGVIKVETFNVDVGNGSTHTLANDVGSLDNAFIRRPGPSDKASGGNLSSTGNQGPNNTHMGVELTSTNQITFRAGTTTARKIMGEVWRYTGAPGGPDEFICRGHIAVNISAGFGFSNVPGIVNRNKTVPFVTGVSTTVNGTSDYDISTYAAYIDTNGFLRVEGPSGGVGTVYVDVVEFTGDNWKIGYGISSNHDVATETVTLNTDSTGSGGSVFNYNPSSCFIEYNMQGDQGGESGLSDVLATVFPSSSTEVEFRLQSQGDGNARNDNDAYIYVIANDGINTTRGSITNIAETNGGAEATVGFPTGAPTDRSLDDLALEWMPDTTGVGTAHARGRLNARINDSTGTIEHWVHRSGNDVDVLYGIIDLTAVAGVANINITDVDGDEIVGNSQNNVIITGTPFEVNQGSGIVELGPNPDYSGVKVQQTVVSWSDTSITINISAGTLSDTFGYLFVTSDSGARGVIALQIGTPPLSYTQAIESLNGDHHWPFDGNLNDIAGVLTRNASNNQGSPGFSAQPLSRDRTQSFTINQQGQRIEIADSNLMNTATLTARSMGGWIRFDEVQSSFVCWYEEGGGVNNLAFFMGIGGILIAQLADTGDDNVHAYSNFKLEPNRNYHILFRFDYGGSGVFELLIDGVVQSSSFGNPLTSTNLDSHSGDVGWGDAEGTLEVFGTDITFPAPVTSYYQDWISWSRFISTSEVREFLFEQGVRGDIQITSDTQADMQAQLDVYANTIQPNSDCTFRIATCTDGDFTLNFDNIVFNDNTTLQIQYLGVDTLTANNLNGSNLDSNKFSLLNGGFINIVTPSKLTVSGLKPNTEVRVLEAGTENEIVGIESVTGVWETELQDNLVDISIINLDFQNQKLKSIDTTTDTFVPVAQRTDRQYQNL